MKLVLFLIWCFLAQVHATSTETELASTQQEQIVELTGPIKEPTTASEHSPKLIVTTIFLGVMFSIGTIVFVYFLTAFYKGTSWLPSLVASGVCFTAAAVAGALLYCEKRK